MCELPECDEASYKQRRPLFYVLFYAASGTRKAGGAAGFAGGSESSPHTQRPFTARGRSGVSPGTRPCRARHRAALFSR